MHEQQQHQYQRQIQQNQHTQNIQLPQQQQQQQQQSHYHQKTQYQKVQQQQVELKNQNRSIYAGNLRKSFTGNNLYDFFGSRSTKYLQETCKVDLLLCKKSGKSRYAFLYVPDHT